MRLTVADFNFEIDNLYDRLPKLIAGYDGDFSVSDYSFANTEEELTEEQSKAEGDFSLGYIETITTYRKIAEWLPLNNAFLLHSATFEVGGEGIAFAAHSGTGKTTHMRLWHELLGDKFKIVNGDKPIIRFFEGEEAPIAYGTPWNGKERLGQNTKTPLKHICFIERAEKNSCEPMKTAEAIDLIFNQVYMPKNPIAVMNTIELINRLINSCKLWKIKCNMDISAAETSYNTIFNK